MRYCKDKKNIKNKPFSRIISVLHRSYSKYINENLKEYSITVGQYPFLMILYFKEYELTEGEIVKLTQNELAKYFGVTEGTVTRALRKLEEEKLIKIEENINNRRQNLVTITNKGKKVAENLKDVEKNWENILFEDFSEEEVIKLKSKLVKSCFKLIKK